MAIAFCDSSERNLLRGIERLIRRTIPVLKDHPFVSASGGEQDRPRQTVEYTGSGIDRPHRPFHRTGGFRSGSNNRTTPRTGGTGYTRAGFSRAR
jgi:hypothetical protein